MTHGRSRCKRRCSCSMLVARRVRCAACDMPCDRWYAARCAAAYSFSCIATHMACFDVACCFCACCMVDVASCRWYIARCMLQVVWCMLYVATRSAHYGRVAVSCADSVACLSDLGLRAHAFDSHGDVFGLTASACKPLEPSTIWQPGRAGRAESAVNGRRTRYARRL